MAASAERAPLAQCRRMRWSGRNRSSWYGLAGSARNSSMPRGMWMAPRIDPCAIRSSDSRRSTTTALPSSDAFANDAGSTSSACRRASSMSWVTVPGMVVLSLRRAFCDGSWCLLAGRSDRDRSAFLERSPRAGARSHRRCRSRDSLRSSGNDSGTQARRWWVHDPMQKETMSWTSFRSSNASGDVPR